MYNDSNPSDKFDVTKLKLIASDVSRRENHHHHQESPGSAHSIKLVGLTRINVLFSTNDGDQQQQH
jgi:hypothetical protein